MATIEENLKIYNETYSWPEDGDEWSKPWGNSRMQWYASILPRINTFIPAKKILEIAPGFGRWTRFLKNSCEELHIVDLSEKCIEKCKTKFISSSNIFYYTNDGLTLDVIENNSMDFIFSFDSLVHANDETMKSYIKEIGKKLNENGVAFIHHSNLNFFKNYSTHVRDTSVDYQKISTYAKENNLNCIVQELINWDNEPFLIDCISTICKKGSKFDKEPIIFKNDRFMDEAKLFSKIYSIYK
jgi:SAM-dependent methyltransferase